MFTSNQCEANIFGMPSKRASDPIVDVTVELKDTLELISFSKD